MHAAIIQRIMGQFLMLFSITLLPPVVIDLLYQEDAARAFFYSYLLLLSAGFLLFLPVRKQKNDLRLRDGFVVVVLYFKVLNVIRKYFDLRLSSWSDSSKSMGLPQVLPSYSGCSSGLRF